MTQDRTITSVTTPWTDAGATPTPPADERVGGTEQASHGEQLGHVGQLATALSAPSAQTRLRAAMAAGSSPHGDLVEVLVERCGVEPDFFVRDMLTWALTRHDHRTVVARLLPELGSTVPQARSQALHTLSKLRDVGTRAAVLALLHDTDDEVARAAWRTAVTLVQPGEEAALAVSLAREVGRGDREVRRSLSRALAALGEDAREAVVHATEHPDPVVRAHARATERLLDDPESGFEDDVDEARRTAALLAAPQVPEEHG